MFFITTHAGVTPGLPYEKSCSESTRPPRIGTEELPASGSHRMICF